MKRTRRTRQSGNLVRKALILRLERGLFLRDIEGATGLKVSRISRFELGDRMLREAALRTLAGFYGTTVDELTAWVRQSLRESA